MKIHKFFDLPLLSIVLLLLPVASTPSLAAYRLYSFDNYQDGTQWVNQPGAHGFNPACNDCPCDNSVVARNPVSGGFRRLVCHDFRNVDGSFWELADEEVVTSVRFDVQGRYTGPAGGSFNCEITAGGATTNRNPNNSFTNNDICRWRIPDAFQDLTAFVNWNLDPALFDDLEIGVQRNNNSTVMCINAVSLSVRVARAQVSRDYVDFGSVCVGEWRDEAFTISSTGDDPLSGNVSLQPCQGFSIVQGGGPFTATPGASHTVVVRFAPTLEDYCSCEILLGVRDLTVDIDGDGIGPECSLSAESHSFGSVPVGTSVDQQFFVENLGCGTLSGVISTSATLCDTEAFTIIQGAGPYSLAHNQRHYLTVRFSPPAGDFYSCAIDLGNPECFELDLDGTGLGGVCDVSQTTHDFGEVPIGSQVAWAFTITNSGLGALTGEVASDPLLCDSTFAIVQGAGPFTLGAGQTRDVTVQFIPTDPDYFFCSVDLGTLECPEVDLEGTGVAVASTSGAPAIPHVTSLGQPLPNPALQDTRFELALAKRDQVSIRIYDVSGRRVHALDQRQLEAGYHMLAWDGRDGAGRRVSAGVYFVEVRTHSGFRNVRRIVMQ